MKRLFLALLIGYIILLVFNNPKYKKSEIPKLVLPTIYISMPEAIEVVSFQGGCVDQALSVLSILERRSGFDMDKEIFVAMGRDELGQGHVQVVKSTDGENPLLYFQFFDIGVQVSANDFVNGKIEKLYKPSTFRAATKVFYPNITLAQLKGFAKIYEKAR